ncbi:MAG TPA: hypothetical protein VJS66_02245 [Burkholderiales bacterium]|nr:hypothetical protein [Burkholderiales bacterium]
MQHHNNPTLSWRKLICLGAGTLLVIAALSACTTARKVGTGAKQAVKGSVEAVKEGGREVKRAIQEN